MIAIEDTYFTMAAKSDQVINKVSIYILQYGEGKLQNKRKSMH